jgi:Major intrinsic protein
VVRQSLSGFVFGTFGALIALSPVGRVSGAHINPAVTLGFLLMGKFRPRMALGYVIAQLAGATLGALPLLAWGVMGRSVAFGATIPGADTPHPWPVYRVRLGRVFGPTRPTESSKKRVRGLRGRAGDRDYNNPSFAISAF